VLSPTASNRGPVMARGSDRKVEVAWWRRFVSMGNQAAGRLHNRHNAVDDAKRPGLHSSLPESRAPPGTLTQSSGIPHTLPLRFPCRAAPGGAERHPLLSNAPLGVGPTNWASGRVLIVPLLASICCETGG
jgi:hypothetical protein